MLHASCFKQHTSKVFSLAEWNRWRASCIRTAFASRVAVVGGKLVQKWRNNSHSDMYRFFNSRSISAGTSSEKHKISLWHICSISLIWYVEVRHQIRPHRSPRKYHVSHQHTKCSLFFFLTCVLCANLISHTYSELNYTATKNALKCSVKKWSIINKSRSHKCKIRTILR